MLFWLLYCCGWCLGSFVGFVCGLFGCCCLVSFGGLGWLVGDFCCTCCLGGFGCYFFAIYYARCLASGLC